MTMIKTSLTGLEHGFSLIDPTVDIQADIIPEETQNHRSDHDPTMADRIQDKRVHETVCPSRRTCNIFLSPSIVLAV